MQSHYHITLTRNGQTFNSKRFADYEADRENFVTCIRDGYPMNKVTVKETGAGMVIKAGRAQWEVSSIPCICK